MSLDRAIIAHLDRMDAIEEQMKADIDELIGAIDKQDLILDPNVVLAEVTQQIRNLLQEKYIPMAGREGFELTKLLEKYDAQGKEIVVDPSKDPTKNKDIVE